MEASFIITFIGDDRPGLVEELAACISEQNGNWLESRLSQLAGKFAGLIRVSLPEDKGDELELALKSLSEKGLSVRVTPVEQQTPTPDDSRRVQLSVLGPDRPGIVREVSAALASQEINVTEFESHVDSAPMSAEALFTASIEAQVADRSDLEELSDTLDEIANQMLLEIQLESSS